MEFINNIITSILSTFERKNCSKKFVIIHPIFNFNNRHDIETGLYYGDENTRRITIHYSSDDDDEECKWEEGTFL
jgi:hypothetical protein